MIEQLGGMPEGVVGLRASGKLTKQDYADVLEPALKEATDSGEARVVFLLESFDGLEAGALLGPEDRAPDRVLQPKGMEAPGGRHRRRLGREGDGALRLGDAGGAEGVRRPRRAGRGEGVGVGRGAPPQWTVILPSRLPRRSMSTRPEMPGTLPELVYCQTR